MKQGDLVRTPFSQNERYVQTMGLVIDPDFIVEAMPTVRLCQIRIIGGPSNGKTIAILRHDLEVIKCNPSRK